MLRNTGLFISALPGLQTTASLIAAYHERQDNIDEALFWYKRAAKNGDKVSYYRYGRLLEQKKSDLPQALKIYFNGAIQDHAESLTALQRHEAVGNEEAIFYLGMLAENKQEWSRALQYYLQLAHKNAEAMYRLGCLYQQDRLSSDGPVIKKDEVQELAWFKKAAASYSTTALEALYTASRTSSAASICLAEIYEENKGLSKERMVEFYRKALALGEVSAAFKLGQLAETNVPANLSEAVRYYTLAIKNDHAEAKKRIEALAQSGHAEAQYAWGFDYYFQSKKNIPESVKWCVKAAENNHPQALQYINKTAFTVDIYSLLAKMFEMAEGINQNHVRAAEFLAKASDAGDKEASFKLGQWYESGSKHGVLKNLIQAKVYFLKAYKQHHPEALSALETLSHVASDAQLEYEIGNIYQTALKDISKAIVWYKSSFDKGFSQSLNQLQQIAHLSPQHAFEIGNLFDKKDTPKPEDAIQYYILAMKKEYDQAKQRVFELAESGNTHAQYALGYDYYYRHKNDIPAAVKWCMKAADANLDNARSFIFTTKFTKEIYVLIAKMFEMGEEVKQHYAQAAEFLRKASDAGEKEASFKLGQWYETGSKLGVGQDLQKAKEYYLKAAKNHHEAALSALEKLAEIIKEPVVDYEIGKIYQTIFTNISTALFWYKKSADKGCSQAIDEFQKIASSMPPYALEIGQLYENSDATTLNVEQALKYYLLGAQKKHQGNEAHLKSLDAAIKLVEKSGDREHTYQLAQHFEKIQDIPNALRWYMAAANLGENQGAKRIEALTKGSREYSLWVADAYQKGTYAIKSSQLAYHYYAIAACLGEQRALDYLQTLAQEGDDQAQYVLGAHYYPVKKEFDQAIIWCLRASKNGNRHALHYLNETDFPIKTLLELGNIYESGNDSVEVDSQKARNFYEKAWRKGEVQAAYLLGRMALNYPQDTEEAFNSQAWDYFLAAAKKGYLLALPSLERMALIGSSLQQKQLADCYAQVPTLSFNPYQINLWNERTSHASQVAATAPPKQTPLPTTQRRRLQL